MNSPSLTAPVEIEPSCAEFALQARDITKKYGATTALHSAHLEVRRGESHALVGRNGAGKSTLVSILTGLNAPDEGVVEFAGRPAPSLTDREGWRRRVACVYQKSTIIPTLSVAENLYLNRQQGSGIAISWRRMRSDAQDLLDSWAVPVNAGAMADSLSVEQRQMVEIARALSYGADIIILDEPTAQLDGRGIDRLFDRMRTLRESDISTLFISHHLSEIFEICDTVTVFRDARHILTAPVPSIDHDELVSAMTGEQGAVDLRGGASTVRAGAPVLTVDNLSLVGMYENITIQLAPGEVLGITGSGSSGRIALAESIVGLRRPSDGSIRVAGRPIKSGSVPDALRAGIGFVPRDRHHEGLVEDLTLAENITMTVPHRISRRGIMSNTRRDAFAQQMIDELSIRASGPEQVVGSLSGGNQQKVVMGRAIADEPKVLVLIHPTAGVDVRSKATLLESIDIVRSRGAGVVIVSDELDDLRPCDRVFVMVHGRITKQFNRDWADADVVAATEGMTPA